MMGLVPQLEHSSPLGRQVSTGIQGAQGLVCDLKTETGTFYCVCSSFLFIFTLDLRWHLRMLERFGHFEEKTQYPTSNYLEIRYFNELFVK